MLDDAERAGPDRGTGPRLLRICFDARVCNGRFPGIGRYAFNLARALADALGPGESLHLLLPPDGEIAARLERLTSDRVDAQRVASSPLSLRQNRQVPGAVRACGANVYHSPYLGMPRSSGAATVVSIHDLIPLQSAGSIRGWRQLPYRTLLKRAVRTADAIVVPCKETAADLRRLLGVDAAQIHIVPYAADPDLIETPVSPSTTPPYALCVGTARPHKNHMRLVEAWARVPLRVDLIFAGQRQTPGSAAARRAIELGVSDRVRFVGEVGDAELAALYRSAALVVLPSEAEGFGLPVVEAMACGAPVACSDIPALREVAGGAAAFFPPHDVAAMAAVLTELLGDTGRLVALRRAGAARAASFSWQETARRSLEIYRSLLSQA